MYHIYTWEQSRAAQDHSCALSAPVTARKQTHAIKVRWQIKPTSRCGSLCFPIVHAHAMLIRSSTKLSLYFILLYCSCATAVAPLTSAVQVTTKNSAHYFTWQAHSFRWYCSGRQLFETRKGGHRTLSTLQRCSSPGAICMAG